LCVTKIAAARKTDQLELLSLLAEVFVIFDGRSQVLFGGILPHEADSG
jgi:hypothetical protein